MDHGRGNRFMFSVKQSFFILVHLKYFRSLDDIPYSINGTLSESKDVTMWARIPRQLHHSLAHFAWHVSSMQI